MVPVVGGLGGGLSQLLFLCVFLHREVQWGEASPSDEVWGAEPPSEIFFLFFTEGQGGNAPLVGGLGGSSDSDGSISKL